MTQSLITVVIFVVLLAMLPMAVKRITQRRQGGLGADLTTSKLISVLAVGPQQRVVTVEVGPQGARTWLVLGVTQQSITTLHTLAPVQPVAIAPVTLNQMQVDAHVKWLGRTRWLGGAMLLASAPAWAQTAGQLPLLVGTGGSGMSFSVPIQTLLFFTALSFLPAILLMMTGFTRIVIVLSLLRQALGTQSAPPNQVVVGLSLFLTFFVMGPTLDRVYRDAYVPYSTNAMAFEDALGKAETPMREFMTKQTRQSDFALFAKLAKLDAAVTPLTAPMRVIIPAFVTSELKSAFQIGFMIFIPFLVIDMVVASVLMSLGMMMLSPVLVALPFKLMLFVLADGWNLLIGSLAASFVQ